LPVYAGPRAFYGRFMDKYEGHIAAATLAITLAKKFAKDDDDHCLRITKDLSKREDFKQAVRELYCWQYAPTGGFSDKLFEALSVASETDYIQLGMNFKNKVLTHIYWSAVSDKDAFFKAAGVSFSAENIFVPKTGEQRNGN